MMNPVNAKLARAKKDARNRRVKSPKIETIVTDELKERWRKANETQATNPGHIARALYEAFCDAVEKGERLVPPFSIKEKRKP